MIVIRKLTKTDHEPMFSLFSEMISHSFPEYSPILRSTILYDEAYWTKSNYLKRLQNKNREIFGAFLGNDLVGMFDIEVPFAGVSLGNWLMVSPKSRLQGVATLLLQEWEKSVKKHGGHMLYIYCNERNIAFYRKMGFVQSGKFEKGWFGLDDYIMTKLIQEPIVF